ncbi:MAG: hypothetical protein U1E67_13130 [Hyphomicrobiales bacterium]
MGAEIVIAALKRAYANFRGFDIDGSTVPPMDGPLRPNAALDAAKQVLTFADIDNLVADQSGVYGSVGNELFALRKQGDAGYEAIAIRKVDAPISALASDRAGALAIGLDGSGVMIQGGHHDGRVVEGPADDRFFSVTALCFVSPDTLLIANGSRQYRAADWKRDLMAKGATGSVWKVDLKKDAGSATKLAENLRFPSGIGVASERVFISEAWGHCVRSVGLGGGETGMALPGLPVYPGRMIRAGDGGFWLAMFAPRNALVEFVLKEDAYRRRMTETIDPEYWIAPSLFAGRSFLEPIQGGTRKKLNMLKPWAPMWSGGLVAKCDESMRPQASFHSRADGNVHGVTSLCESEGNLLVGAKGSGLVVALPLEGEGARA